MESDVNKRPSVRPLRGLWEAGEAPRAAKPDDCAQKLSKGVRPGRVLSAYERMLAMAAESWEVRRFAVYLCRKSIHLRSSGVSPTGSAASWAHGIRSEAVGRSPQRSAAPGAEPAELPAGIKVQTRPRVM